jgi:hypothetical protein
MADRVEREFPTPAKNLLRIAIRLIGIAWIDDRVEMNNPAEAGFLMHCRGGVVSADRLKRR